MKSTAGAAETVGGKAARVFGVHGIRTDDGDRRTSTWSMLAWDLEDARERAQLDPAVELVAEVWDSAAREAEQAKRFRRAHLRVVR